MEIRNSLIMLTKISSVFPVTRKSGINLEKRVTYLNGKKFLIELLLDSLLVTQIAYFISLCTGG